MWVVFRTSDREVVGSTVEGGVELTKEEALADVVGGLIGKPDILDFDAVEVKAGEGPSNLLRAVGEGRARLTELGDGKLAVEDDSAEAAIVRVTTNAKDFHPVDGVPLLPGDGTSFLVVTLQKVSQLDGTPMERGSGEDDEVIWLRPSHGTVREDTEERTEAIRSVTFVSGTARFRFYSDSAKRLASVEMLSTNKNLVVGGLRVEFT